MNDETTKRKIPQQKRSRERVDLILDTAESLFAKFGYENTTTNAIAEEAKVSIGSLYQFFPNKEALKDALIERYLEEMRQTKFADIPSNLTISQVVFFMVDNNMRFSATHKGFEALFTHDLATNIHHEVANNINSVLSAYYPQLNPVRRWQTAEMVLALFKGAMMMLDKVENVSLEWLIDETSMAIVQYVRGVLIREKIPLSDDIA
jgi:AcrR family transcriptional regulator